MPTPVAAFDSNKSSERFANRHTSIRALDYASSVTPADFRRLALSLPDAAEGSHFHVQDFRVGGKIFATLAYQKDGCGVLLLTPEQQAGMIQDAPEVFLPVPNKWGEKGATLVRLAKVKADILAGALRMALSNKTTKTNKQGKAPKRRA
jgi:hypothetical protein